MSKPASFTVAKVCKAMTAAERKGYRVAKLRLYAKLPGSRKLERSLHNKFDHLRTRGEWFRRADDIDAWIKEGCPA